MSTETQIIEIDFENFLTLFYRVYKGNDSEMESKFISTMSELERRLQDLDSQKIEDQILLRNLIIIKLKYWERIIIEVIDSFSESDDGGNLLVNAIMYCFDYLSLKAREAIESSDTIKIYEDVSKILPTPDEYFIQYNEESSPAILNFPNLLIKKFLDNYAFKKLHESDVEITKKEGFYFKKLAIDIENGNDFDLALDKYISDSIISADITELPIFIFLDTSDSKEIIKYYEAVKKLIYSLDLELLYEYDPTHGSWIRKAISKVKKFFTSDEFVERLKKVEHGLEINTINKTQSKIDKNQAEAFAAILNASANIPRLSTLIGSLLIVKTINDHNEPAVFCRTLSTNELIYLKEHPQLLQNPTIILNQLELYNAQQSSNQNLIEGA